MRSWATVLVIWGTAIPLAAQEATEPPVQLDPTDIVAPFPRFPLGRGSLLSPTRTEILRSQSGSSVSVVSGEQLRRSGQPLLQDALRGLPGLDIVRSGGVGQQTSVFLRGTESRHTKVLLDGIPLNDPSGPSRAFDFSTLTVDNIERVEILRGPQSTLYGSDAIGGVINIITRRGEGPRQIRFRTLAGRYGTFQQSASMSGSTDRMYYSLGGSFLETDGFSTAAPRLGNREKDGFRNGSLSGRWGWLITDGVDLDVVLRYSDSDAQIDGFEFPTGPVDDLLRKLKNETFGMRTQLRLSNDEGNIEHKLGWSVSKFHRRDTSPGLFGTAAFEGETQQLDWQANLLLLSSDHHRNTLTTGAAYIDEQASSTSLPRDSLQTTGMFVQDQVVLGDRWSTVVGGRWDEYSLAGTARTYRVTSRYTLVDIGAAIHGSIGTGFRAPAINELFDPNLGNLDLRPEESFGWEMGWEQALAEGNLVVDATYFRNDIDDLVVFQFTGTGVFGGQLFNVESALSTGVELAGSLRLGADTTATAAYTYTDARNRTHGTQLVRRPANKVRLGLEHQFGDSGPLVSLNYQWVDQRDDFDGGGLITRLDEYSLLNATVSYDLSDRLQLFARLDNVTDENYEEVFGFASPRFGVYSGAVLLLGGE